MQSFNHRLLRTFVFLLATVFITNTVYAGGMMVTVTLNSMAGSKMVQSQASNEHNNAHHCHDQVIADEAHQQGHSQGYHQSRHKPQSQSGCSHCNHCLACFSVIPQGQIKTISSLNQVVLAISFAEIYLSPTSAQPQKPPIV